MSGIPTCFIIKYICTLLNDYFKYISVRLLNMFTFVIFHQVV